MIVGACSPCVTNENVLCGGVFLLESLIEVKLNLIIIFQMDIYAPVRAPVCVSDGQAFHILQFCGRQHDLWEAMKVPEVHCRFTLTLASFCGCLRQH